MKTKWLAIFVLALIAVGAVMFFAGRFTAQQTPAPPVAQESTHAPAPPATPPPATLAATSLPATSPPATLPAAASAKPTAAGAKPSAYARYLPDAKLTPGDTLAVTKADICTPGYSSKVRDVPQAVKNAVYAEYGIVSHAPGAYEVDHLISLELGGSNSERNLWPQSYKGPWNAHSKDKLEDHLHALVCKNQLSLKAAQRAIATDWIAAYHTYFGGQ